MESILQDSEPNYSRSLSGLAKRHQHYKRSLEQVLTDLQPAATKLHISSAVFLILVFVIIALATIAFACTVYMFHRRRQKRQQQQSEAGRMLGTQGNREKAASPQYWPHDGEPSQLPRDARRSGRYSWNSQGNVDLTRGPSNGSGSGEDTLVEDELVDHPWDMSGRKLYTVSERTEESSIRNRSPLPTPTPHTQQQRPRRDDWRKSHSSKSSETAHDDGYAEPEPKGSKRYATPPTFKFTREDDDKVGSDRESAYEDIYDDYYGGGDDRGSMMSRISRNQPSAMSGHLNVTAQGAKHDSAYSLDGLVDMYALGSPLTERGGGSPIASSPTKGWFSRSGTRNSDHSMLSPMENLARNFSRSSLGRSTRRPSPAPPVLPEQASLPRNGSPNYAGGELPRKESDISLPYARPQPPELGLPYTRSNGPLPSLLQPRSGQVHDDSPDPSPTYSPVLPQRYPSPHGSSRERDITSPVLPSPRPLITPLSVPPPSVLYKPPPIPQEYLALPPLNDSKRIPPPFLRNTPTPGASSYSSSSTSAGRRPVISPMHSTTSSIDQATRRKLRGASLYGEIMRMGGSGASVNSRGGS